MTFTKKTFVIRAEYYERFRRESFYNRREIKEILDEILAAWIEANPERPRRDVKHLAESRHDIEIEQIKAAMDASGNNRATAAARLGISRMALFQKCKRYGLTFSKSKRGSV